jgi:glycosyltransferase involved in cell wall biosynthesis
MKKILFLGETFRADAQSWIKGIQKQSGQKIETMEIPYSDSRIRRICNAVIFLFKVLQSRFASQYDFVLAERATSYGFFSLFVNAKLRVVAQQGITDAYPESGFSGFYKRILQRIVYKNVDLIHAWGHVMTYAMLTSGADPRKIMVLPKGIDLKRFEFRNPDSFDFLKTRLIVTRSLFELYRHEDILLTVAKHKKIGNYLNVDFIGDGPEEDKLKKMSADLNIANQINFVGKVPNEELPYLLNKSILYLAVPTTEGVSSSLFEAMAVGCFPIVSDLPANQVFLSNNENGILVPVKNVTKLADAIQFAIDNPERIKNAILKNRVYIEANVDFDKNMKIIYDTYLTFFSQKLNF